MMIAKPWEDVAVCERAIAALTQPANDEERKRLARWQAQLTRLTASRTGRHTRPTEGTEEGTNG